MAREIVYRTTKRALTAAELERVTVPAGATRVTVKDTEVAGLELRLSATGARSWAVSKRVHGIQRRFTIPNSAGLSLAEARKAGREVLAQLDRGRDPVAERREARTKARLARLGVGKAWTLGELIDEYGQKVAKPAGQRSWEDRKLHLEREYRPLLALPVATITETHLWRILDAATARGARVSGWYGLRNLRTVLRWAVQRKLIASDPTAAMPMKDLGTRMRERPRARVLSASELTRLWRVLEADAGNVYAAIFRMILLTGQRLGEVSGMRWSDLDLARGEWHQPTNKADRPHTVPLSAEALAIVRAQPRRPGVAYVFTTATGGHLDRRSGNWTRWTEAYAERSGVTGWSRHDLRRTAATLLASLKVERTVVELLLNHSETGAKGGMVAATYNRHSYEIEKREAVERLARHIRALVEDGTGEVIEMRPRRQEPSG